MLNAPKGLRDCFVKQKVPFWVKLFSVIGRWERCQVTNAQVSQSLVDRSGNGYPISFRLLTFSLHGIQYSGSLVAFRVLVHSHMCSFYRCLISPYFGILLKALQLLWFQTLIQHHCYNDSAPHTIYRDFLWVSDNDEETGDCCFLD